MASDSLQYQSGDKALHSKEAPIGNRQLAIGND
jgi:hypothetical protein